MKSNSENMTCMFYMRQEKKNNGVYAVSLVDLKSVLILASRVCSISSQQRDPRITFATPVSIATIRLFGRERAGARGIEGEKIVCIYRM